jgi:SAM-dependent methyltransferase
MKPPRGLYESPAIWNQVLTPGQYNTALALRDFWPQSLNSVLDVGCGDGKITRSIADLAGNRLIGLDFSHEALSRTGLTAVLGETSRIPFQSDSFDLVLTTDLLEHLPEAVEEKALQEIFRVARKWAMIAVPFNENLLLGSTRCAGCGKTYHVNWHQRCYGLQSLFPRIPKPWAIRGIILTGEPSSPFSPVEIRLRRELLDQWASWQEAICPYCSTPGQRASEMGPLSDLISGALGPLVYRQITATPQLLSHSEMVLLCASENCDFSLPVTMPPGPVIPAGTLKISGNDPEPFLLPYPRFARYVNATGGGFVAQFPVNAPVTHLSINWLPNDKRYIELSIEDGCGAMWSGTISRPSDGKFTIDLPRKAVAGYYGFLVRLAAESALPESLEVNAEGDFEFLEPSGSERAQYRLLSCGGIPVYLQIVSKLQLDPKFFSGGSDPDPSLRKTEWSELFNEMESFLSLKLSLIDSECDRTAAIRERERILKERDHFVAECSRIEKERSQLL